MASDVLTLVPIIFSRNPDNFDDYWRVASKITPTTAPTRAQSPQPPSSSASMHPRSPSADPTGPSDRDGAYNVRSVPVRLYLPDGPVMQDLVPPVLEDGKCFLVCYIGGIGSLRFLHPAELFKHPDFLSILTPKLFLGMPHTLAHYLSTHIPLLFPQHPPDTPDIAYAIIQGVLAPPEAEMAWLGACLTGADGWLNICVGIVRDILGGLGR